MPRTAVFLLWSISTAGPQAGTPLEGPLTHSCPGQAVAEDRSGHHFSYLPPDNARIGWDFGRNPWNDDILGQENFCMPRGYPRLLGVLDRAVVNGETLVSFDLGFDFRSIVVVTAGAVQLDAYADCAVRVFVREVQAADARAQASGRAFANRFGADVVITDYRMADGVTEEGGLPIGEHPELITTRRGELMTALRPLLERLGNAVAADGKHLVSLNLMNEPELVSMPVTEILARLEDGWGPAARPDTALAWQLRLSPQASRKELLSALRALGSEAYLGVSRRGTALELHATTVTPSDVRSFLLAMRDTIASVAPAADVHIGWADDQSAIANTRLLDNEARRSVTSLASFHVYAGDHPLRTTRFDFRDALGNRPVRISEWGLGCPADLHGAILNSLRTVRDRGFEGVLFWWDPTHCFDPSVYGQVLSSFAAEAPVPFASIGDAASLEGDSGTSAMSFPVRLTVPTPASASFRYSTFPGSASEGSDYLRLDRSPVTVPACVPSHPIGVTVNGDTVPEPRETFGLRLSEPAGLVLAVPADAEAVGTILDDEASRFVPLPPCRLADTRGAFGPGGGPALGAGAARSFPVVGRCGVPAAASAIAANLTAVAPTDRGNLRLHAATAPAPLASALNFAAGRTRANNAIVLLGGDGMVTVINDMPAGSSGMVHVVVDVFGYFTESEATETPQGK